MTQVKPFPLHLGPMPFSAHGTRRDRLWAVLRLNAARRSLTSLGDFLAEIFEVTK